MTEPEVRAAVDAAIRSHLAARSAPPAAVGSRPATPLPAHEPSHGRFTRAALAGDPPDGRCVIEPAVECTGCGYCESHGH